MQSNPWLNIPTSIFSRMTEFANQHNAVNLAQGFPDFDGPELIKEAAFKAMREGKNQYAPAIGIEPLRKSIAKYVLDRSGISYDYQSETTVFTGATEALFCAIGALTDADSEVVTFAPFYDSYPAATFLNKATFKALPLTPPDWSFAPEELAKMITSKTKLLILNSPHNPTGKVFTKAELLAIAELVTKHNLYVVTDEVYQELVFDGAEHFSFATLPKMRERTVTITSTSKTFSMTGWKVGFALAPPELTKAMRNLHQFTVFCTATPLQWGMVTAFQELSSSYYKEFRKEYADRRELLLTTLREAGFKVLPPQGSYFAIADFSDISQKSDLEFAMAMTEKTGVAAIPLSPFYLNGTPHRLLRFGFCKSVATISAARERFRKNGLPS